jgi:RNA polymerase sigma factor (sigma-70 family)
MGSMSAPQQQLFSELEQHRSFLWGLCYRMTGCASDAEDVVQDTFERALTRPPPDRERALRPWLVRVAMNRARDLLRQRRRRGYKGPYLPAPIETSENSPAEPRAQSEPEARYGQLESVTFAFLLALEALTPTQRAVVLLRDVFDHSVEETAQTLGQSTANVKTTHHRARRCLQAYDAKRCIPTPDRQRQTRAALEAFVSRLAADDVDGLRELLAENVRTWHDANGEFFAAGSVVAGRDKVILFHRNLSAKLRRVPLAFGFGNYNGFAAVLARYPAHAREAPQVLLRVDIDSDGRINEIYGVVATRKLSASNFSKL